MWGDNTCILQFSGCGAARRITDHSKVATELLERLRETQEELLALKQREAVAKQAAVRVRGKAQGNSHELPPVEKVCEQYASGTM